MTLVVYEPDAKVREALSEQLRGRGCRVAAFGNARVAFLFALSRFDQIDGLLVNVGMSDEGRWLVEHLELLPGALAVAVYDEVSPDGVDISFVSGDPSARYPLPGARHQPPPIRPR